MFAVLFHRQQRMRCTTLRCSPYVTVSGCAMVVAWSCGITNSVEWSPDKNSTPQLELIECSSRLCSIGSVLFSDVDADSASISVAQVFLFRFAADVLDGVAATRCESSVDKHRCTCSMAVHVLDGGRRHRGVLLEWLVVQRALAQLHHVLTSSVTVHQLRGLRARGWLHLRHHWFECCLDSRKSFISLICLVKHGSTPTMLMRCLCIVQ